MKTCPGCGLNNCLNLISQLSAYTLSLQDDWFIHQLVVDTYAAQHVVADQKTIAGSFALIGLYLVYERGFTGKQVQKTHMRIANLRKSWPKFHAPTNTWPLTVANVLKAPEGEARNVLIKNWGASVWQIWKEKNQDQIQKLAEINQVT